MAPEHLLLVTESLLSHWSMLNVMTETWISLPPFPRPRDYYMTLCHYVFVSYGSVSLLRSRWPPEGHQWTSPINGKTSSALLLASQLWFHLFTYLFFFVFFLTVHLAKTLSVTDVLEQRWQELEQRKRWRGSKPTLTGATLALSVWKNDDILPRQNVCFFEFCFALSNFSLAKAISFTLQ